MVSDAVHHGMAGFMPHGTCWLWTPGILGLQIFGNAVIALAYYSIPFVLFKFIRLRISIATAIVLWPLLPRLEKAGTIEEFVQRQTIEKLEEQNHALEDANKRLDETNHALQEQMTAMREATHVLAGRESRISELRAEVERLKALGASGGR